MQTNRLSTYWYLLCLCSLLLGSSLSSQLVVETAPNNTATQLGYGVNVAGLDTAALQTMGFDWIKIFGPPGERLPFNVLLRIDATSATLADLDRFEASMAALATSLCCSNGVAGVPNDCGVEREELLGVDFRGFDFEK